MSDRNHAFASDEPPEIQVHPHDCYHAVIEKCAALPPLVTCLLYTSDAADE